MLRRKAAAVAFAMLMGGTLAACGGEGDTKVDGGPGQSTEEDPTLGDPNGGGTMDKGGSGTAGDRTTDGSDEGTPGGSNGATNGSGTGDG